MVYLYAGMGVVMLTGIMAIFEMGLSLTGQSVLQSLLRTPPDPYFADSLQDRDQALLEFLVDQKKLCVDKCNDVEEAVKKSFSELVVDEGLCGALNRFDNFDQDDTTKWALIGEGSHWDNSCQLNQGSHRALVKKKSGNEQISYQLFSCALSGEDIWYDNNLEMNRCSFERE